MLKLIRLFRRLLAGGVLLFVIILPAGVFSPFTAGDYSAMGESPPTISETLTWLLPLEILLLYAVYLIDPKKKERK